MTAPEQIDVTQADIEADYESRNAYELAIEMGFSHKQAMRRSSEVIARHRIAATRAAEERIAGLVEALHAGERFLDAAYSAWSCDESYHRVLRMLDRADQFRSALAAAKALEGKMQARCCCEITTLSANPACPIHGGYNEKV